MREDESLREVADAEIRHFADENNLLYIGESSALSDTNIKEVVETLMQSKCLNSDTSPFSHIFRIVLVITNNNSSFD